MICREQAKGFCQGCGGKLCFWRGVPKGAEAKKVHIMNIWY